MHSGSAKYFRIQNRYLDSDGSRCQLESHAGSYADERLAISPDSSGQPTRTQPKSRTDLNERGYPYGNLQIRRLYINFIISAFS